MPFSRTWFLSFLFIFTSAGFGFSLSFFLFSFFLCSTVFFFLSLDFLVQLEDIVLGAVVLCSHFSFFFFFHKTVFSLSGLTHATRSIVSFSCKRTRCFYLLFWWFPKRCFVLLVWLSVVFSSSFSSSSFSSSDVIRLILFNFVVKSSTSIY